MSDTNRPTQHAEATLPDSSEQRGRSLSVSELALCLRETLDTAFPTGVWVTGEIRGLNRARSGHVYFDLVEVSHDEPGAPPVATISVALFRSDKDRVNTAIKRHGNVMRMTDGVTVRVQAMLDFFAPRGQIQLRMIAIDPSHTLAAIAAHRASVTAALAADGILRHNAELVAADVPLRVGLVTSLGSAAHADVLRVLTASGFAFRVIEADTPVQGPDAAEGIAAALSATAPLADVVLVVRGGGSATDLAAFDHESVGRAIAGCERPVFTGIGHETDRCVADEAAHTACSTPTAAARAVTGRVEGWLERLDDTARSVALRSRRGLTAAAHRADRAAADTTRAVRVAVGQADRALNAHIQGVRRASRSAIANSELRLNADAQTLTLTSRSRVQAAAQHVDGSASRLVRTGSGAHRRSLSRLDEATARLTVAGRHRTGNADRHLDAVETRIRTLDPARILRRGWSLTRRSDGTLLRSVLDVPVGDEMITDLADGTLTSTLRSYRVDNPNQPGESQSHATSPRTSDKEQPSP